jgi:hypothetical protein
MGKIPTIFIFTLSVLFFSRSVRADDDTRLYTASQKEDNGRQEPGGSVMNTPRTCAYDYYRFEIDRHGQLFFKEAATCIGNNGQQLGGTSETHLVCQLDATLHCDSSMERFPNVSFTASEQGLAMNGSAIAWKDAQQAKQMLPTIKLGAERNIKALEGLSENLCPLVFGRYVVQLKRDGHISSDANTEMVLKSCAQKFRDICSSPESKARMVSLAAVSKENKDVDAGDIDHFCKTVQQSH